VKLSSKSFLPEISKAINLLDNSNSFAVCRKQLEDCWRKIAFLRRKKQVLEDPFLSRSVIPTFRLNQYLAGYPPQSRRIVALPRPVEIEIQPEMQVAW
jgi:hypothetical protein